MSSYKLFQIKGPIAAGQTKTLPQWLNFSGENDDWNNYTLFQIGIESPQSYPLQNYQQLKDKQGNFIELRVLPMEENEKVKIDLATNDENSIEEFLISKKDILEFQDLQANITQTSLSILQNLDEYTVINLTINLGE